MPIWFKMSREAEIRVRVTIPARVNFWADESLNSLRTPAGISNLEIVR